MLLHCLQTVLLVAGLAGVSGPGCFVPDPALRSPKAVTISLGESVKDFLAANRIAVGPREAVSDFTVDIDHTADTGPMLFTDHWLSLTFADGTQGFALPPGRRLAIGQTAGHITDFLFTPFAEPQPLDAVTGFASNLFEQLQDQGWSAEVAVFLPKSEGDFNPRTHSAMVSQLHGQGGHDVELIVREAGFVPQHGARLLTPVSVHPLADLQPGYLLEVSVTELADMDPKAADTLLPRRLLVNGNEERPLSLRPWVEAPDWTPQGAGMTPRPTGGREKSDWAAPALQLRR